MKNGRNDEIEIYQNFDFHFHVGKKTRCCAQSTSQTHGEVPFFTYVHRAYTFSIARYDAFAYGTAYIIRPTKSNDPACGCSGLPLPPKGHLSLS